ncbi:MAG: helix-turn-helix transcriptional regulator [Selenomonadaceae bacterium]|nr:helix-turn-helix transcriptional regulator [Selenomonadaceae bacterium]
MTENFGARLKFLRTDRELSADELAQKSGIHAATILRIERRGIRPQLATVLKLADALNVKPALLLGDVT